MLLPDFRAAMVGPPDIVVATPACIGTCISKNILQSSSLEESLATLVLNEIFFKYLDHYIPHRCQCILMCKCGLQISAKNFHPFMQTSEKRNELVRNHDVTPTRG